MYCDRCGARFEGARNFCSVCGKAAGAPAGLTGVTTGVTTMPAQSRLAGHIRLLAILWFALSAFAMLPGFLLLTLSGFLASLLPADAPSFLPGLFPAIGIGFICLGAVGCIAGWGLLERAPWARNLTIVLACFSLLHMPFGTALGIYTLWVLLPAESEAEYRRAASAHGFEARA